MRKIAKDTDWLWSSRNYSSRKAHSTMPVHSILLSSRRHLDDEASRRGVKWAPLFTQRVNQRNAYIFLWVQTRHLCVSSHLRRSTRRSHAGCWQEKFEDDTSTTIAQAAVAPSGLKARLARRCDAAAAVRGGVSAGGRVGHRQPGAARVHLAAGDAARRGARLAGAMAGQGGGGGGAAHAVLGDGSDRGREPSPPGIRAVACWAT